MLSTGCCYFPADEVSFGTSSATGKSLNSSSSGMKELTHAVLVSQIFAVKILRHEFGAARGSFRLVPLQDPPGTAASSLFERFAIHLGIAITACSCPCRLKKETMCADPCPLTSSGINSPSL